MQGNVKRLTNFTPEYRLRVGNYRILFEIEKDNEKVVGRATGGDFGFRINKSIALGMVKPELATTGQKLKIDILGKMHDATIQDESPYDAENKLLRA